MGQKEKLLVRLAGRPKDFTWQELVRLLKLLGYVEVKPGKTGGSRRRFVHDKYARIILHKPHPGNELKPYQVNLIIEVFENEGIF